MSQTLYELNQAYQSLAELLSDPEIPEGDIMAALSGVMDEINIKVGNMARLVKNLQADAAIIKTEEQRLAARRRAYENRADGVKRYAQQVMEQAGTSKIKDALLTVAIQNNPAAVAIIDETKIPAEYWTQPAPTVSPQAIKDAIKAGVDVPGAELRQTASLRIR